MSCANITSLRRYLKLSPLGTSSIELNETATLITDYPDPVRQICSKIRPGYFSNCLDLFSIFEAINRFFSDFSQLVLYIYIYIYIYMNECHKS